MSALDKLPKFLYLPTNQQDLQQAQRLFHGRGHAYKGLEHITIDWLSPVLLITLFAPETDGNIQRLSTYLRSVFPLCESVQLQHRYILSGPIDILWGKEISEINASENNLLYRVQLGNARNTGLFLDMRNGRKWVQENAENKRVLNLFSYTCGFSVAAMAGKAKAVVNVDMSSPALNIGRKNHHLNDHNLAQVKFEKLNIFKSFGRLKKRGPFDLLICDPPTFQKGSVDIKRDYPKIMRRLNEFMAPKASLLLCLNAPDLGRNFLLDNMASLAPDYQYIKEIAPPHVYQEAEGKGLKTLLFKAQ